MRSGMKKSLHLTRAILGIFLAVAASLGSVMLAVPQAQASEATPCIVVSSVQFNGNQLDQSMPFLSQGKLYLKATDHLTIHGRVGSPVDGGSCTPTSALDSYTPSSTMQMSLQNSGAPSSTVGVTAWATAGSTDFTTDITSSNLCTPASVCSVSLSSLSLELADTSTPGAPAIATNGLNSDASFQAMEITSISSESTASQISVFVDGKPDVMNADGTRSFNISSKDTNPSTAKVSVVLGDGMAACTTPPAGTSPTGPLPSGSCRVDIAGKTPKYLHTIGSVGSQNFTGLADNTYALTVEIPGLPVSSSTIRIDTQAPTVAVQPLPSSVLQFSDVTNGNTDPNKKISVFPSTTSVPSVTLKLVDNPGTADNPGTFASGVNIPPSTSSIQVRIPAPKDLNNGTLGLSKSVGLSVAPDGTISVPLSDEGIYDLSQITVGSVSDNFGTRLLQLQPCPCLQE